jgi:hypothetical protein
MVVTRFVTTFEPLISAGRVSTETGAAAGREWAEFTPAATARPPGNSFLLLFSSTSALNKGRFRVQSRLEYWLSFANAEDDIVAPKTNSARCA